MCLCVSMHACLSAFLHEHDSYFRDALNYSRSGRSMSWLFMSECFIFLSFLPRRCGYETLCFLSQPHKFVGRIGNLITSPNGSHLLFYKLHFILRNKNTLLNPPASHPFPGLLSNKSIFSRKVSYSSCDLGLLQS